MGSKYEYEIGNSDSNALVDDGRDRYAGGVTSMDDFLSRFFPDVWRRKQAPDVNDYCKFDSQVLTTFTSSLYVAGLLASLAAASVTRVHGRRPSMLAGGASFLAGAALNGFARDVPMLIVGRILLGIGVGFANQVCCCRRANQIRSILLHPIV
jgi:MFS family permease